MEILRNFSRGRGYIDGITIINLEGEILFSAKLNEALSHQAPLVEVVGKKFSQVYQRPAFLESTLFKCMDIGMPIYIENQGLQTAEQAELTISSLSIPIQSGNRIVGAIDLSTREVDTQRQGESYPIQLSAAHFSRGVLDSMVADHTVRYRLSDVIANDRTMGEIKEYIPVVAGCNLPVMLHGERGTGKAMIAQVIHSESPRSRRKFVSQNCATVSPELLDSLLFGRNEMDGGLIGLADGGTLFLEEVDRLPLPLQEKLLQVAQSGSLRLPGSSRDHQVDIKLITTLGQDPQGAIQMGTLSQALFRALSILSISLPPLRERKRDIPDLVSLYVKRHNRTFYKKIEYLSKDLLEALEGYHWPNNIWEVEQLIVFGMSRVNPNSDTLKRSDIQERFTQMASDTPNSLPLDFSLPLTDAVDRYEAALIHQALQATEGNVSKAAKLLQIPRQTLQRKIKQHHLSEVH